MCKCKSQARPVLSSITGIDFTDERALMRARDSFDDFTVAKVVKAPTNVNKGSFALS